MMQAVLGRLHPMGAVRKGGVRAEVLGGREAGRTRRDVGVKQRGLMMGMLPAVQGSFMPFRGRQSDTS